MNDYAATLQLYREAFTKYKSSSPTRTDSPNVEHLSQLITVAFDERTTSAAVLIGPKGSGKKQALKLAVNRTNVTRFITINCLLYNTPVLIYEALIRECELEDPDAILASRAKLKSNDRVLETWLKESTRFFQENNAVIYFSNFERIIKHKQSFFYTLLDGINQHAAKCFLCFATSSLVFMESMDKRVKSRFLYNIVYFGFKDENVMVFLNNYLLNCIESSSTTEVMKRFVESEAIRGLVQRFFSITQSYRMLITLFAGVFCTLKSEDLRIFEESPGKGLELFERVLRLNIFRLIEANHAAVVESLPDCHRIILKMLLNNPAIGNGTAPMKMQVLLSQIQLPQNQRGESIAHKYEQVSTFNAVMDLAAMKYVVIRPFPISQFSEIYFVGNPVLRTLKELL